MHTTRRIRYLQRNFPTALTKRALDVGCGNFLHLSNFAPGSVGMDGRALQAPAGYSFMHWNFADDISDLLVRNGHDPRFDVIWCSDVFEHILAPHEFLLNLRRALQDDGMLFLGVPLVNPLALPGFQTRTNVFNYFCGFLSQDHVNFFTFRTLKFTVEFAGFSVDGWYSPFLPYKKPPMSGLEPVTILALRKLADWTYGPKSYKSLDATGRLVWKELVRAD